MYSLGLYPPDSFSIVRGGPQDMGAKEILPQAAWYFFSEWVAVPKPGLPLAGFSASLAIEEDLSTWASTAMAQARDYPPLIWLAAPEVLRSASWSADGEKIVHQGKRLNWATVPRLPLNGSWLDASSLAFFCGRPLKLRGFAEVDEASFRVKSLWPEDFCLPESVPDTFVPALLSHELSQDSAASRLRAWVRALPEGGARAGFSVERLWQRSAGSSIMPGQPFIGAMLNGAQGDDDEAHGGHFALMTGQLGPGGALDDCLVYNFYTLDAESEKGIIAAPVPLDVYLGDLNAGQAWYRPSCMMLATLRDARCAWYLQSALGRVFNQFYRHQFSYQHARANCAGISITTLRQIGWPVPEAGPESRLLAFPAALLSALQEGSIARGKAVFDYLTEDRTKLYPAVAFEQLTADLWCRLVQGAASGKAGSSSKLIDALTEDVDQLLLLRVPQFPSSRAWGDWPVASAKEYRARIPVDPKKRKIIPVPARPFPAHLRDPLTPPEPPLRSDRLLSGLSITALLSGLLAVYLAFF
jgi:hypothetical protein